ncbi:MAG: hypothetical protein KatS3mg033_1284 [Thermonema sp.]|uniref:LysE family translocator n=1 Tax=Thermonema sp. TaxID=2231181 RepID=UPI0021DEF12C|nr:LysE family transporter [Thermonema sp.]GIV39484.1 MAG: hypothetical protein KatS3mg033_1284 [Thermonema sp.]
MILAIVAGIFIGIVLSCTLGTVFFSLIQNSIENGFKSGMMIAGGVILSDTMFILLAYFSARFIPENNHNWEFYVSLAGALLLWGLGLASLLKRHIKKRPVKRMQFQKKVYFVVNGFLLNTLNPVNFFIWVGIAAQLEAKGYFPDSYNWLFFCFALLGIFSTESLIALSAQRLKRVFNERTLLRISRLSGLVFLLIGSKLFYDALTKYTDHLMW